MKILFAAAILVAATFARSEPVTGPNGERLYAWPTEIGAWHNASREICEKYGYHASTAEELARWAAEDAAANSAATAAAVVQAEAEAKQKAALAAAEDAAKKADTAKAEAAAAQSAAGNKKPDTETRLAITEKALGITWK